jgi:FMN hydrolase / 5-amino-6-(5-phospho-D-ribitylamino)uracil phosphatase
MSLERWVVLDVGETLIDETRFWAAWADELGIPRLTFMAGLGAVIARGDAYRGVFDLFGISDWQELADSVEARHGGFTPADLYPDAVPAIDALRGAGYRVAITANQPAVRDPQLRALGIEPDVMAMSEAMGVSKPDPAFFVRTLELLGDPPPDRVAYVGDRIDNDVLPAIQAGLRAVWLRRGPWGRIQVLPPGDAGVLVIASLAELAVRADELWHGRGDPSGRRDEGPRPTPGDGTHGGPRGGPDGGPGGGPDGPPANLRSASR